MQYRALGRSGLSVSAVGLGANNFGARIDFAAARQVVHAALDHGVTLIDTADAYGDPRGGSEEIIGRILGERRKDVVLATKFGLAMDGSGTRQGASRRYIMQAAEASLKRLRTEWIDLYQLHRPDPATPIEETLSALDHLVRQGKVRAIGCSNLSASELDAAQACAQRCNLAAFVSCQDQYSLLVRGIEGDLVPAIERHKLGLLPYFPLASGLLTGKYRRRAPLPAGSRLASSKRHSNRFAHDAYFAAVEELAAFCAARGRSLLELAFGWLLDKPFVASVIAGATSPEQIAQNVAAAGWTLSAEERAEADRLTADLPPPGSPE